MNEAIIVLGMHRSGTSCLTGCLNDFGLSLGKVSDSNKHNKKGNQENKAVFNLNESLLRFNQGSWRRPPLKPLIWNQELETRRDEVISYYDEMPKPWGIKDPRMLLTYPFWQAHLPNHQLVGTVRHPVAVIKSLLARKHKNLTMSEEQALFLWQTYNEKLLNIYNQSSFPIINFDLEQSSYLSKINLIKTKLNMAHKKDVGFFDKDLVHQHKYSMDECPKSLLPLYDKLLEFCI
jgi:hypothetical protein